MRTRRGRRVAPASPLTAFWATSGIVPLCVLQLQSSPARQTARLYSSQVVWWASSVEATSAFHRLSRDAEVTTKDLQQALSRLEYLRIRWNEIQPSEELRHRAERLLAAHRLRAADALQLGASLIWCGNHTRGRVFIGADGNLADAAEAEGFTVIRIL